MTEECAERWLASIRAAGTLDLTVHLRDPDVEPKMRPASGDGSHYRALIEEHNGNALDKRLQVREWVGHAGATICGRLLLLEELWVDYTPEPIDTLCPGCYDGADVPIDTLLWTDDDDEVWPEDDQPERRVETVTVVGEVL